MKSESRGPENTETDMIRTIILDVDGTLTDGGIYYDNTGNELKKFCTKDAAGIICARAAGVAVVVLTGRECAATVRRLTELGVTELYQGVKDKAAWLRDRLAETGEDKSAVAYIGDDINDLAPMKCCGYIGCPADAAAEVKALADYVSPVAGGHGAARDVIEHILREEGIWESVVDSAYGAGI